MVATPQKPRRPRHRDAQREERLGHSLLDEMRRINRKAWELLARTESEGDHRGAIVALRQVRECLESLGEMLAKAEAANGATAGARATKIVVRFVGPGDKPERERP